MLLASPAVSGRIPEIFASRTASIPTATGRGARRTRSRRMGHIAFGGGRHRCMGIVFAQLQLRALWSHLLRNFEFELLDSNYPVDYTNLIAGPTPPCRVRYRRV
jgi:sterol 14-demethylase